MHPDPVIFTVEIQHWADGEVGAKVFGVGDSEQDRKAIAFALREAATLVEDGLPLDLKMLA